MKTNIISIIILVVYVLIAAPTAKSQERTSALETVRPIPKIQLAILLDASNSMDGLIDQAKARLWNIVNTLTSLKYDGKEPKIEIALYMYGNDGLDKKEHWVKQITHFTGDLDLISEKLFAITTWGGSEHCGAVIDHAVKNLEWSRDKNSMKLVYIAGNEPFNQGTINYIEAISGAKEKEIYINTIYCGNCEYGVRELWKDGADRGLGKYFCINSNEKVVFVQTPYDDKLFECNERLNTTYIYYGSSGQRAYVNQSTQDANAQSVSSANYAERTVSKSKAVYSNDEWDLVDKHKQDNSFYKKVDKKTLPDAYQKMTEEELKAELEKMLALRTLINKEIAELSLKRQEYIDKNSSESAGKDDFGAAVNSSILDLAKKKGFATK